MLGFSFLLFLFLFLFIFLFYSSIYFFDLVNQGILSTKVIWHDNKLHCILPFLGMYFIYKHLVSTVSKFRCGA
jgi:hypothetical protein